MSAHYSSVALLLTGPTATGKTEVAVRLAERHPVDLISVDSAMVYRGMDIGTAKPPPQVLARHPHALVDIRDPADPYSAADFLADADAAVRSARAAGRLPVLVGGTMLYVRAFREGLAALPPASAAMREAIAGEAAVRGWPALYAELERLDPAAAAGIHPNNTVRIQRALEVLRVTGRPISRWWATQADSHVADRLGLDLLEVALVPDALETLSAPIAGRFDAMLRTGLIEEVAALRARGDLSLDLPSMRSVGYRQVWQYLDGTLSRESVRERGVAATRALAKRQLTWLRRWDHVERLAAGDSGGAVERIERLLSRYERPS